MSTREFFAQRLAAELPAFNNVIRALPGDRLDYKPHEKNTAAGQLAWQLAKAERSGVTPSFFAGFQLIENRLLANRNNEYVE